MMEDLVKVPRFRRGRPVGITRRTLLPAREVVKYLVDKRRLGSIDGLVDRRKGVIQKRNKLADLDRRQVEAMNARRAKLADWLQETPVAVGTPAHATINSVEFLEAAIDYQVGEYLSRTITPRLAISYVKDEAARLAPMQPACWKPGHRFWSQYELKWLLNFH